MADCTRFDCTDYDPCPDCLNEARNAGLFPAGEAATVGPRCGNNPNVQLTPGDRQAVDEFKAYLARRAAGGPPERNPFETEVCSACHVELCATCHACRCARGMDWTCGSSHCPAAVLPLSEMPLEERDPETEEIWRDIQRKA